MVLKEIRFIRNKGEKNEWRIEGKPDESGIAQPLTLENINLIVGLNASGKSRTVDAIRRIADLVSGEVKLSNLEGMRFDTVQYSLKFENSTVQVIMTTNGRFTMNKVPLKYWSVIERLPKKSVFYNYKNSKEVFDDFDDLGLNNFDFLSSQFYIKGFETVAP